MFKIYGSMRWHLPAVVSGQSVLFRNSSVLLKQANVTRYIATNRRVKTKGELEEENLERQMKSSDLIVRWGAIARSEKFKKGMTKYMIGAYLIFLLYGFHFMKKVYYKDKELENLTQKANAGCINEYEALRLKELSGKLRTRDKLKLDEYRRMQKEDSTLENFDGISLENNDQNRLNEHVLPPRDTTEFFDAKAETYDQDLSFESKIIMMGRRRKWLTRHCKGDVLEVACGTGLNVEYLDPTKINSITFLDSSEKMMEITNKKFRERFPNFKKAAFVLGKAEELVDMASVDPVAKSDDENSTNCIEKVSSGNARIHYDTIIQSFGLCSHYDPVKALQNFATLLKPGGRIVLLEHGRGTYDFINKILDARAVKRVETWGCRWNLDIGEILDDSGLEIVEEKRTHLGTTWCIVAKRKGESKRKDEVGFVEKYLRSGVRARLDQFATEEAVEKPKK
ncbi:putative RNA methyltransferase Ecym_3223 [Eremothecium cymbalariae DBVPG|uniref:Methyltransferase type 11 domain-containing protein n=1 Tax=Eremothecium cymbalariae (strain CBS 270.75 / DBVPG 7215 / KCTC 17166 / NRRL Y-17582) TaxID=931890 RepID=G8JRF1_ERECY|nr:Hypothetical protein Ecym_3223 [Eremothecium cymbalariae DBVPG\